MSTPSPRVSVIVATHRQSPYLTEALASVAAQTLDDVEVVIVDDGSPDPEAVEEAAAAVLPGAHVIHQPASGVSVARNRGAFVATGEFLAFLDDDDRWRADRLESHLAAHMREPDAIASYSRMNVIDRHGAVVLTSPPITDGSSAAIAVGETRVMMPNLLVRHSAFAACGGFHSALTHAEDADLVLRLLHLGPVTPIDEPLVDYREHPENTVKNHRDLVRGIDAVLRLHLASQAAQRDGEWARALRGARRRNARYAWWRALRAARRSIGAGHVRPALGEVGWALRTAPTGLMDGLARRARPGARS